MRSYVVTINQSQGINTLKYLITSNNIRIIKTQL